MIPTVLQQLVHDPIAEEDWTSSAEEGADVAELEGEELAAYHHTGTPSGYICPDCGGALWETEENGMLHFRCRVGHAWAQEGLLEEQAGAIEEALWSALRALQEQSSLAARVAKNARLRSNHLVASRFERRIQDLDQRASVIRKLLQNGITGESNRKNYPGKLDPLAGDDVPEIVPPGEPS